MIKMYKAYAQDLYNIKISALPVLSGENNKSVTGLLASIAEMRPQLRNNLNELFDEFRLNHQVLPDVVKKIDVINNKLITKLYVIGYKAKKKIKPYPHH